MRPFPPAIAAARAARSGILVRHLIWIIATDRATGAPSPIGFWTGDDHRDFTIRGEVRTYFGAGTHLGQDAIVHATGVRVRQNRVTLSGLKPEVELAIRGYETRLAPCEIHRAEFSPITGDLLAEPDMVLDGEIAGLSMKTGAAGGTATSDLTILSNAVFLTRPLTLKRSDETLRARAPDDAFMQYAKVSGSKGDSWGAK